MKDAQSRTGPFRRAVTVAAVSVLMLSPLTRGAGPETKPGATSAGAPAVSGTFVGGRARMDRTVALDLRVLDAQGEEVARVDWLRFGRSTRAVQAEAGLMFASSAGGRWRIRLGLLPANAAGAMDAVIEVPRNGSPDGKPVRMVVRLELVPKAAEGFCPSGFRIHLEPADPTAPVTHEVAPLPEPIPKTLFTRVYDVRDLVTCAGERAAGPATKPAGEPTEEQEAERASRHVMTVVRQIEPESWGHWATLRMLRRQLVITQTGENHRRVRALLAQLRSSPEEVGKDPSALEIPPSRAPEDESF